MYDITKGGGECEKCEKGGGRLKILQRSVISYLNSPYVFSAHRVLAQVVILVYFHLNRYTFVSPQKELVDSMQTVLLPRVLGHIEKILKQNDTGYVAGAKVIIHFNAIYLPVSRLIEWTLRFAYKINIFFRIPFGGHHICPMHGVPCEFGKDIFNIKDIVLISQKVKFLCKSCIKRI